MAGDDDPELKEQVLTGKLFSAACPKCGRSQRIVANMRYSDYGPKNYFVYLIPEDMMEKERPFIESLGGLKQNGTRVHLAHTLSELQSIIKTYDSGLKYPESHIFQSKEARQASNALHTALDDMVEKMRKRSKPSLWQRLFGK